MKAALRAVGKFVRRAGVALERFGGVQRAVMELPGLNLATNPDETYYVRQYLHWLRPVVDSQKRVIDVGCGSGRLTAPVARLLPEATVTGIDMSPGKIEHAREQTAGLTNVTVHVADAREYLRGVEDASVDLALFTEVDFFDPDGDGLLDTVARKVCPFGVLFASFRSQWFNLAFSVRARDFASAKRVRDKREGQLWSGANRLRWYTPDEIRERLAGLGFDSELHAIGVLSGREGDALDSVARPGLLSKRDQDELHELEVSLADHYLACGRYILAVARKRSVEAP